MNDAKHTVVSDASLYSFQDFSDERGDLYVVEIARHIPFRVKRLFWITRLPLSVVRGGHAHKSCHQFIIPMMGCLDVVLTDGTASRTVHLDRPSEGLYIPPGLWATECNYSADALYLVLASDHFDESDYFRVYQDFLAYKND